MTHDSDSKSHLILVVCFRVNFTDATFEDVIPSHFEQLCNCFVFSAWDITQQIPVVCTSVFVKSMVVHYSYSILVVAIIQVATQFQQCSDMQFFSQLTRDYGDKESKVIQNTVGNVFSGQVVGETAKTLSERFGKVLQQRQSMTINRNDKSTSISTQMDSLIPASKISNLTQGMFVGAVSDNFDERIDQKIFHAEIVVDSAKVSAEMKAYQPIPVIVEFKNEDSSDNLKETIEANYRKVKQEILSLVDSEMERVKNDPLLSHLIKE